MTEQQRNSRERLYRTIAISLAVVTALLLIPPEWIGFTFQAREKAADPESREIEIVRVPPEKFEPPPPLPPRPEPEPEPVPEQEVVELVEPEQEVVELEFQMPTPEIDIPIQQQQEQERQLKAQATEMFKNQMQDVNVAVPKEVQRENRKTNQLAAHTSETMVDFNAPDVNVATPAPAARRSATASPTPVARQTRTGATLRNDANAPAVDIPRGNTSKQNQTAPLAVGGSDSGAKVTYSAQTGGASVAIPTNRRSNNSGAAPNVSVNSGTAGVSYSAASTDAPTGSATRRSTSGNSKLESVRAALASKYGLPLVSVNSLGQRSTEAAKWNLLLPQISDLLRQTRGKGVWRGGSNIKSVERDGDRVIIRYTDGITHVIVPTQDGLAALFVARTSGARPVTSKVEEAEAARNALSRYARGAS